MLKSKGKTCMVEEPSHLKQLSLNVRKIGLMVKDAVKKDKHFLKWRQVETDLCTTPEIRCLFNHFLGLV
jgi:hypothetical protein